MEYIKARKPRSIDAWVDEASYRRIAEAAGQLGTSQLKPVFEKLGGTIPYHTIRLVARHLEVRD